MLDFLMTATVSDVAEKQPVARVGGPRKERNPKGMTIRVFRDGSIYPSAELIEKFDLEYGPKVMKDDKALSSTGNGFDVIDTQLFPSFQVGKRILILNVTPKSSPKVDLFSSTTYNEDGTPKSSVLDQGSKTFGMDDLIPSIEEIYGITFFKPAVVKDGIQASSEVEGIEFVDMSIVANPVTNEPWTVPNGVTYIPKKVSRGADKGQVTTQRREKPAFYAFLPEVVIEKAESIQTPTCNEREIVEPIPVVETLQEAREFGRAAVEAGY
jgi:hypothetical protein